VYLSITDQSLYDAVKKLEKVCASKISLTETAIKSPRKVDTIPISMIAGTTSA
jgi:hypothetical protein